MPPMLASAPGSMGKNRPVSLMLSLSCLRVMPGCTVTVRSSAFTLSTRFMRFTSMLMPPCTASRWPSSEEPAAYGMTGTLCCAARRTASCTSCVLSAKTTAAGGGAWMEPSSRPCCSRTARAQEYCAPKRCASASSKAWGAGRSVTGACEGGALACMGGSPKKAVPEYHRPPWPDHRPSCLCQAVPRGIRSERPPRTPGVRGSRRGCCRAARSGCRWQAAAALPGG
ncbi:MAG: hypothetical protein BWX79_01833 [Alphaproteobacteria bacterium ADurb.Bin100]|nr:MAG: hypothetical protein BWX79_01833 [Alphaproteobacteria bacterium ADurb.Bin100]